MFNDSIIYEYPKTKRIVVIGDIHGDLKRFKKILIDANIINNNLEWIAEPQNTVVVQLGDQVDSANREPTTEDWEKIQDIDMIHFTNSLNMIALSKGGMVISLIGNHELMNVIGNFTYVSKLSNFELRDKYFKPTGSLSPILGKRPIIIKIGDLCFCHAGLKKVHIDILEKYGKDISYLNDIWRKFILQGSIMIEDKEIFDKILLEQDGILWTRELDDEENTRYVLNKLGCHYIFIGHTPVENIQLRTNQIWYVDTAISRAFNSKRYQYLEINDYNINIKTITETE